MRLGVFTVLLGNKPLAEAVSYCKQLGIQAVEIGAGGYPGKAHCDPAQLLNDPDQLAAFRDVFRKYEMELSAISCHGNPVHPDPGIADAFDRDFRQAILLAEKLGVDRIVGFSGCPGGCPEDRTPNWITCPWPQDFSDALKYQWDVLIPYWRQMALFASEHGITRICLEMHPGFTVHNPEALLTLRKEVGSLIGANFDPSHLFWQGIDPAAAIRYLGDAIYFFHAKDTRIDPVNAPRIGVLDTKHYGDESGRGWIFRTVGYGHDYQVWKDIVSSLRMVGYDDVISIEHEDSLMSVGEGLSKAVRFLKEVMPFETRGEMFWA